MWVVAGAHNKVVAKKTPEKLKYEALKKHIYKNLGLLATKKALEHLRLIDLKHNIVFLA